LQVDAGEAPVGRAGDGDGVGRRGGEGHVDRAAGGVDDAVAGAAVGGVEPAVAVVLERLGGGVGRHDAHRPGGQRPAGERERERRVGPVAGGALGLFGGGDELVVGVLREDLAGGDLAVVFLEETGEDDQVGTAR